MRQGIKLIFYMHGCPKRQPFDSNILMGLDSSILMGLLRHVHILSKVHTWYFQNEEFVLYISRINEGIKKSFHTNSKHVINYLIAMYHRDLLLVSCLLFTIVIYCHAKHSG